MEESDSEPSDNSTKKKIGLVLIVIGIGLALTGGVWMLDNYVASQMAGAFLLVIGLFITSVGMKLNGREKIDTGFLFPTSTNPSMKTRLVWIIIVTIFTIVFYAYEGAI